MNLYEIFTTLAVGLIALILGLRLAWVIRGSRRPFSRWVRKRLSIWSDLSAALLFPLLLLILFVFGSVARQVGSHGSVVAVPRSFPVALHVLAVLFLFLFLLALLYALGSWIYWFSLRNLFEGSKAAKNNAAHRTTSRRMALRAFLIALALFAVAIITDGHARAWRQAGHYPSPACATCPYAPHHNAAATDCENCPIMGASDKKGKIQAGKKDAPKKSASPSKGDSKKKR